MTWNHEYFVNREDVRLYVYRKRATAPAAGEAAKPVLLLVHGATPTTCKFPEAKTIR
jgi:alpha-beta hydrolase superfamily lysophospholipase